MMFCQVKWSIAEKNDKKIHMERFFVMKNAVWMEEFVYLQHQSYKLSFLNYPCFSS